MIARSPAGFVTGEHGELLGPCCQCERTVGVRNILMLNRRGAIPGKGWGCIVCGLPSEGVVAVLCDDCVEVYPPRFVCRGFPAIDGRQPFDALPPGDFDHDLSKHPEVTRH